MENKIEVELINAKVMDFKLDSGDLIQGLKIFYLEDRVKDNSILGDVETAFISSEKMPKYKEFFEDLKQYVIDSRRIGQKPMVMLYFIVNSINSKPTITNIEFNRENSDFEF